jgi:hypothetical protein
VLSSEEAFGGEVFEAVRFSREGRAFSQCETGAGRKKKSSAAIT